MIFKFILEPFHLLISDVYRQWVPCDCNFSYNLKPVFLKLCTCFLPGLQEGGEGMVGLGVGGGADATSSLKFDLFFYFCFFTFFFFFLSLCNFGHTVFSFLFQVASLTQEQFVSIIRMGEAALQNPVPMKTIISIICEYLLVINVDMNINFNV